MSHSEDGLRPDEFAEAAEAAIHDALTRAAEDIPGTLAAAGLLGVCATEADGGLGLDLEFAVPLAQASGRLRLRFALAEQMLLARHLAGTALASALAQGQTLATIAWQGQHDDDWVGNARRAQDVRWLLVRHSQGAVLLDVLNAPQKIETTLDPENLQTWLDIRQCPVLAELGADATANLWREGALLMAATAHGAADAALNAAATHTSTRVQFDRPLSARQAVRHWLSRMKLYHEAGGAAIARALQRNEWGSPREPLSALMLNLHYATFIIEKAIHLHGGMGFTWEVPLHHALREVRKIDAAWGGGALTQSVGKRFIQTCKG
jgi:alkylation response protein AidB-like acyl-CoA dehydrogenase